MIKDAPTPKKIRSNYVTVLILLVVFTIIEVTVSYIAGGIKVSDPAIDMAILSSVLSSNLDIPIERNICFAGEAGLSGEIRPVSRIEQRIREASKMGFTKIFISKYHRNINAKDSAIQVIPAGKIETLVKLLFG